MTSRVVAAVKRPTVLTYLVPSYHSTKYHCPDCPNMQYGKGQRITSVLLQEDNTSPYCNQRHHLYPVSLPPHSPPPGGRTGGGGGRSRKSTANVGSDRRQALLGTDEDPGPGVGTALGFIRSRLADDGFAQACKDVCKRE